MIEKNKTEVYFDGACPLCKREISLYKRLDKAEAINWVDVSTQRPELSGMDKNVLLKRFHIKKNNGRIYSGAKAFFELWSEIPGWKWLGKFGKYQFVVNFAEIVYIIFLKVRPLMQRFAGLVEKINARKIRSACEDK